MYVESRKMLQMIYVQSRNRYTGVEDKCMDTKGGSGVVGWIGRLGLTYIYTHYWYYAENKSPTYKIDH